MTEQVKHLWCKFPQCRFSLNAKDEVKSWWCLRCHKWLWGDYYNVCIRFAYQDQGEEWGIVGDSGEERGERVGGRGQ